MNQSSASESNIQQISVEETLEEKGQKDTLFTQNIDHFEHLEQNTNANESSRQNEKQKQEYSSTNGDKEKKPQHNVPKKKVAPSLFKKIKVFCPYKNQAIFVCTQKCTIQAMICIQNECPCQKAHSQCLLKKIFNIQQKIDESYRKYEDKSKRSLIKTIKLKFQQLFAQTKTLQQDLISKIQYMGLSDQQIQFLNLWNNGTLNIKTKNSIFNDSVLLKLQTAKGQFFSFFNASKFISRKNIVQLTQTNLAKSLQDYQQKHKLCLNNLKRQFESIKKKFTGSIFANSSIIESKIQEEKLISLLPQFISIQNLSKWSRTDSKQNYWNLLIKKNIIYRNILILVKNSYQKTFGAFINCNLSKNMNMFDSEQIRKVKDLVYQSKKQEQFLFSLTNNKKIKSLNKIDDDQWTIQPSFSNESKSLDKLKVQTKQIKSLFSNSNVNTNVNFQITNSVISFKDGLLFQKFENLSEIDITGVDSRYYQRSTAEVIEIYHVVIDSKQTLNNLKEKVQPIQNTTKNLFNQAQNNTFANNSNNSKIQPANSMFGGGSFPFGGKK